MTGQSVGGAAAGQIVTTRTGTTDIAGAEAIGVAAARVVTGSGVRYRVVRSSVGSTRVDAVGGEVVGRVAAG